MKTHISWTTTRMLLLVLASFLQMYVVTDRNACTDISYFSDKTQKNSVSYKIFCWFKGLGFLQCVQQCLFRRRCQSINYDLTTNICDLNDAVNDSVHSKQGSVFTEISKWPQRLALQCENHNCPISTVCTIGRETTDCSPDVCPKANGYIKADNLPFLYKLHKESVSFETARQTCLQEEGRLAEIESAQKNNYIRSLYRRLATYIWLGATNLRGDIWLWNASGTKLEFEFWKDGLPDNRGNNEHCLTFDSVSPVGWNDRPCSDTLRFICEKVYP